VGGGGGAAVGVRLVMEQNCLLGFKTVIRVRSTVVTTVNAMTTGWSKIRLPNFLLRKKQDLVNEYVT
jgi:hypothetical protein